MQHHDSHGLEPSHSTSIRVIGSLNLDFTTVTPRFPEPGETMYASSFNISPGGKGANQAVACGRLSRIDKAVAQNIGVTMVGAVGANDSYYQNLIRPTLEHAGVRCDLIDQVEGSTTGSASIIVDASASGENRIMIVPGANYDGMQFTGELQRRITAAVAGPVDVWVLQGEIPHNTNLLFLELMESAKSKYGEQSEDAEGVRPLPDIIYNPAPVPKDGWRSFQPSQFGAIDHLIVNETEMRHIAPSAEEIGEFLLDGTYDKEAQDLYTEQVAAFFHLGNVKTVIVTLGSKGVYYSHMGGLDNKRRTGSVPGIVVDSVVDTTAAGDTFVGAYAVGVARWKETQIKKESTFDPLGAIQWANKAAALCVQRSGAMDSIPWGYEVE